MYLIDKKNNRLKNQLPEKRFSELGFKERQNLQKWIADTPDVLGEELLIIQEEFDGFHDTNERLDLLALDKEGNIVVIENKLDDTGRDVTWQVIKYASYCSTLTKDNIRKIYQDYLNKKGINASAAEAISDFFDGREYEEIQLNKLQSQRIMMIAGNYRKEVTSTALWLLNYKLQIQCFKASIYQLENELILDIEQIIPTKDAAEYIISMADKAQETITGQAEMSKRHHIRREFWGLLLENLKGKTPIYQSISPSKDHWLSSGGTNISGVHYSCLATQSYVGIELAISRGSKNENKVLFDEILKHKDEVENNFGDSLDWQRLPEKKMSRIAYKKKGLNLFEKEDWNEMLSFLELNIIKIETVLRPLLKTVKRKVKM